MIGDNASPLGWLEVGAWVVLVVLALWGVAGLVGWWFESAKSRGQGRSKSSTSSHKPEVFESSNQSWREKPWRR